MRTGGKHGKRGMQRMKYKTARRSGWRTRRRGGEGGGISARNVIYGEAFVESAGSSGEYTRSLAWDRRIILYAEGWRRGAPRATGVVAPSCFSFAPAARSSVPHLKERSLYTFCLATREPRGLDRAITALFRSSSFEADPV